LKSVVLIAAAFGWLVSVQDVLFQDAEKSVTLSGFMTHKLSRTVEEVRFSGTGKPLAINVRSNGLLLNGENVSGVIKPQGRTFFIESANLSGSAVAIMDTIVRQEYELSKKLREALTPDQSRTRFDSPTMIYSGSVVEGKIATESKLRVRSDTAGTRSIKKEEKDVQQSFSQNLDLTGASGTINLDPQAKTTATNLKSGRIEGPVEFTFKRIEQDAGAKEPTETTLQGRGDLLTFDFTGSERVLILQGNVHLVGTGSFNGTTNVDKLIITVDEKLQPIRYETEGKPATTTVKTGGGR
jgi:hypothetical protein